jgi:hypothetical protein
MALSPEILRDELVGVRKEIENAKREKDEAEARYNKLMQEEKALITLLSGRDEQTKGLEILPSPQQTYFQDIISAPESTDEAVVNKTEVIRQIIREHGVSGASPADVWRGVQKRNIQMHRNYVYAVLARLVDKNEVTQHDGRYTLVQVQ